MLIEEAFSINTLCLRLIVFTSTSDTDFCDDEVKYCSVSSIDQELCTLILVAFPFRATSRLLGSIVFVVVLLDK